ncbi:efflux RND transporter periplasmic adaptor subunit [Pseudoalteromonas sp. MMG005]|uniref:efflux RND transporter periplasmic adaptor subunit n=1 Tax=Pseudoalteromonas sp. MMG005 TaxID=2822682 RepID=UPI001B39D74E|nr:efflux RND transporter periplasmic adaptor subunit [Pseudoalteromonas sp. MMG005]MBQ4847699.1 efflux RND transporter periplasmic adaptor subunit [Pseudoalteromonas sp. MMG005]
MQVAARAVLCLLATAIMCVASDSHANSTEVDVFLPTLDRSPETIQLTGSIESAQHANIATMEAGSVSTLFVDVGTEVAKGDKLLQLNATLAKLELDQAKASLQAANIAKIEAERLLNEVVALSNRQSVAKTLIGERKANLANAQAELIKQQAAVSLQQELIQRHTLYAPFSGVIAKREVDIGEWITPQNSVLTLVGQSNLRLVLDVPQEYYTQMIQQPHLSATVNADTLDSRAIDITVSRIVGVADPISRTFVVHVDLPSNNMATGDFITGMSATAKIHMASQKNTVWLPKSAIKQHPDGGSSIFAIESGIATRYLVDIIESHADKVAVTGLNGTEHIVVSGVELLKNGSSLTIKSTVGSAL